MASFCSFLILHILPLQLCIGAKVVLLIDLESKTSLCVHWGMLKLRHFELSTVIGTLGQHDAILSEESIRIGVVKILK